MQSMSLKLQDPLLLSIQKVSTLKSEQTNRMFTIFLPRQFASQICHILMERRFCVISSVRLVPTVNKNNDYTDFTNQKM